MAKLTLLGREFDIAPYNLRELRAAAPVIDAINAEIAGHVPKAQTVDEIVETNEDLFQSITHTMGQWVTVICIGLVKIDPTLTADAVEEQVGMGDIAALSQAYSDIIEEAGLHRGGAPAPTVITTPPVGASVTV